MIFESYTDCLLDAFKSHPKASEIVKIKQDILRSIGEFHNFMPSSVLYVGFNPAILYETANRIAVTCISVAAREYLIENGIKFDYIPPEELLTLNEKFDSVVALDEFFTFANTDQEQKDLVNTLSRVTGQYLITTCRDYKNQDYKDREFSTPSLVRYGKTKTIYLEFHDHDSYDKNQMSTRVYRIADTDLQVYGPFDRRTVFFKQLAKFSSDAGAVGFTVHKQLMYKSVLKKNYEHVISIRFDNDEPQRPY